MGNKYLRGLLVIGATALVRQFRNGPDKATPHFASLLARKPVRVATVAMANKMARIVWALMTRGETYRAAHTRCSLPRRITGSARPHWLHEVAGVMARPVRPGQGQPTECQKRHSLKSRMGPYLRTPSGPAVQRRLHQQAEQKTAPDQRQYIRFLLQCGSHPQRTFREAACRWMSFHMPRSGWQGLLPKPAIYSACQARPIRRFE
jgi:hypothetical protein